MVDLKVENVSVFYQAAQALEDISIRVRGAETISIIGSNGAGKSTLLKTICGLQPPRDGRIMLNNNEITSCSTYAIARMGLVMVPEGREIFLPMTVLENLEMGIFARQGSKKKQMLPRALEKVYSLFPILKEREKQTASTLSGGEQQMLAIGRALMSDPKILLLDEPSLGLAPIIVESTFQTLHELRRSGMAMVLVEQNAYEALRFADRGYVLENGRLILEGTGTQLLQRQDIKDLYLGGG